MTTFLKDLASFIFGDYDYIVDEVHFETLRACYTYVHVTILKASAFGEPFF